MFEQIWSHLFELAPETRRPEGRPKLFLIGVYEIFSSTEIFVSAKPACRSAGSNCNGVSNRASNFKAAAKGAGLAGILPHDIRRSAIRNFRKAGINESDGMKISGHGTNSVYKRYDIIDEADQRRAIEKAQELQRGEMEKLRWSR